MKIFSSYCAAKYVKNIARMTIASLCVLCSFCQPDPRIKYPFPLVLTYEDQTVVAEDSLRVLILGNSITKSPPAPGIGWHHDWGMAASRKDKDFVHVLSRQINAHPKVSGKCVLRFANVASYEGDFYTLDSIGLHERFRAYREFNPDLVIFRWGDNVPDSLALEYSFERQFMEVISYFKQNPRKAPLFMITSTWYPHKTIINQQMRNASASHKTQYVDFGELRYVPDMSAQGSGLFEDGGVASHPSDQGMQAIADLIYGDFQEMIQ